MDNDTDEAIIRHRLIQQLATDHGKDVFASSFRVLSDAPAAEDAMQEVFLKLYRMQLSRLQEITDWKYYLKSMAVSASIDGLRKNKKYSNDIDMDSITELVDPSPTLEAHTTTSKSIAKFLKALTELPNRDSEVFLLRFLEEFSYEQIAQRMEMRVSNVGVSINRTRKKLLSKLTLNEF